MLLIVTALLTILQLKYFFPSRGGLRAYTRMRNTRAAGQARVLCPMVCVNSVF